MAAAADADLASRGVGVMLQLQAGTAATNKGLASGGARASRSIQILPKGALARDGARGRKGGGAAPKGGGAPSVSSPPPLVADSDFVGALLRTQGSQPNADTTHGDSGSGRRGGVAGMRRRNGGGGQVSSGAVSGDVRKSVPTASRQEHHVLTAGQVQGKGSLLGMQRARAQGFARALQAETLAAAHVQAAAAAAATLKVDQAARHAEQAKVLTLTGVRRSRAEIQERYAQHSEGGQGGVTSTHGGGNFETEGALVMPGVADGLPSASLVFSVAPSSAKRPPLSRTGRNFSGARGAADATTPVADASGGSDSVRLKRLHEQRTQITPSKNTAGKREAAFPVHLQRVTYGPIEGVMGFRSGASAVEHKETAAEMDATVDSQVSLGGGVDLGAVLGDTPSHGSLPQPQAAQGGAQDTSSAHQEHQEHQVATTDAHSAMSPVPRGKVWDGVIAGRLQAEDTRQQEHRGVFRQAGSSDTRSRASGASGAAPDVPAHSPSRSLALGGRGQLPKRQGGAGGLNNAPAESVSRITLTLDQGDDTMSKNRASGSIEGDALYIPSTSDSRMRRSAPIIVATRAASRSLSP